MANVLKLVPYNLLAAALWVAPVSATDVDKTRIDQTPSGTVLIDESQFGLIVGGSTGQGTLTYQGKTYPFEIGGISVGATIGAAKVRASGKVYNLDNLSQFPGNYTKLDANVAAADGKGTLRLSNTSGVIMDLQADTEGLQLNLGVGGVKVTMKPQTTVE